MQSLVLSKRTVKIAQERVRSRLIDGRARTDNSIYIPETEMEGSKADIEDQSVICILQSGRFVLAIFLWVTR